MSKIEPQLIELLQRLIQTPSINPPGNENLAADVVEEFAQKTGLITRRLEKEPGRTNIIVEVGQGRPILLVPCHLDTVSPGDGWTLEPLAGILKDGYMYGRGSVDNKGPLACALMALALLKEEGISSKVVVVGAADEERGSLLGMEWLLKEGLVEGDYALVPDAASSMTEVYIAEKGVVHLEVFSYGKQAHGSTPQIGINSCWKLMDLLQNLRDDPLTSPPHPIMSPASMNLGSINGGVAANVVPGRCKAELDFRFLPGTTANDVINHLKKHIDRVSSEDPEAKFEIKTIMALEPSALEEEHQFVSMVQNSAKKILGRRPVVAGQSGVTVAKQLVFAGIPAVNFSPGEMNMAHQSDERVKVEELVKFTEFLCELTRSIQKRS